MVRSLAALIVILFTATAASAQSANPPRRSLLIPLYGAQVALHAADVYTTTVALRAGHIESNPMMRGLTPRQMLGVKIAASTAVVLFADRLSGRHRAAAIAVMIAGNSALAVVAANNYRLAKR